MKRFISVILILSMLIMAGCQKQEPRHGRDRRDRKDRNNGEITVYTEDDMTSIATDVIDSLYELTSDDSYSSMYLQVDGISNLIDQLNDASIDEDEDVYVINITRDFMNSLAEELSDEEEIEFSDAVADMIHSNIDNILNSISPAPSLGVNYYAISSILKYSRNYVASDIEDQIWIIPTDDDSIAVAVSFVNSGENVITAKASFIYVGDDIDDYIDTIEEHVDVDTMAVDW